MKIHNLTEFVIISVFILVFALGFLPTTALAQGTALSIEGGELTEGKTVGLFITLTKAIDGLGRLDASLTSENPEVLELKSISPEAVSEQFLQIDSQSDKTIKFKMVDLGKKVDPGDKNVNLLKLEVKAGKPGKVQLSMSDIKYTDEDGNVIEPVVTPAEITVISSAKEQQQQPETGEKEEKASEEETKQKEEPEQDKNAGREKQEEDKKPEKKERAKTPKDAYLPEIQGVGIKLGETKDLQLHISSLPGGLRVARLAITSSGGLSFDNLKILNPSYHEIVDESEDLLSFRVGDFDREVPPETSSLNLAEIKVNAIKLGNTDIKVKLTLWTDEGEVVKTSSSTTIEIGVGPIGSSSAPVTDPDGDGLYEDVNGDGEVTESDAFVLTFNLESEAVQNNPELFDFNRDGKVTFGDAVELIKLIK